MKINTNILLYLLIIVASLMGEVQIAVAESLPDKKAPLLFENFDQGKIETRGVVALQAEFAPDDLGGQCLLMSKKRQRILIPLASHFDPHVGSVEMRIRFTGDIKSVMQSNQYLFRAHTAGHKHGFFLLYGKRAKGLVFFVSDKNGQRTVLRDENAANWRSGQWHHIAITWDTRIADQAELALYVDYQLMDRKRNLKLPMDWQAWERLAQAEKKKFPLPTQNLTIGNWSGQGVLAAPLSFDDIRIYDQQRQYLQAGSNQTQHN